MPPNQAQIVKEELDKLQSRSYINNKLFIKFNNRIKAGNNLTKISNPGSHFCAFMVPYDQKSKMIFIGHHIKADEWIPPGGHLELGETPKQTVVREFKEELDSVITSKSIHFFDINITLISNRISTCKTHFDLWHVVMVKKQNFVYDKGEFYDASWFSIEAAIEKAYRKQIKTPLTNLKYFLTTL